MHSLKTARPLLTSVAYFVLFAMVLFSYVCIPLELICLFTDDYCRIIGVQSFKGSLRRSCYLSPILGESEMQLESQFCGGYIDPASLDVVGYIQLNGENVVKDKGYICPLGQVCRVRLCTIVLTDLRSYRPPGTRKS